MLQKIVNGIAITSGVISLSIVGLGGYVFIRKDAIIENVKGQVMEAVSGGLGSLAGDALMPPSSLPSPDAPAAGSAGLSIPSF